MEKLLYIRHAYHNKTKSNDFLVDLLKNRYEITIYDIDPYSQDNEIMLKNSPIKEVDVLVLFQLPIDGNLIKKYINFKKGVFFPMYDGVPSRQNKIWLSWKDFNIINFSKALHNELLNMGLSSFYVQYFPKPIKFNNMGDINSVFFWNRRTKININTITPILKSLNIKNVHIHKALDPENNFIEAKSNDFNISCSTWYKDKEDMLKDIENSSIYIAPRRYEGIGMSFLEAMAMGRCVIAPNNPTMNEYIEDGVTGILYNLQKPKITKKYNIREIQKNALDYIEKGYKNWEIEQNTIYSIIDTPVNINESLLKKSKFFMSKSFIENVFSITNSSDKTHKIITILGIRIKFKRQNEVMSHA